MGRDSENVPSPLAPPPLSDDQVLEALWDYVQGHFCYGDNFLKEMELKDLVATPIYRYILELYIETRTAEWVTEPYRGEYLAQEFPSPTPVDIWSVHISPPIGGGSTTQTHVVPSSTSVVNCAQCTGIGHVQCGACAGSMSTSCSACDGTGKVTALLIDGTSRRVKCAKCKGTRRMTCDGCKGKGTTPCITCLGFRRVKNYQQLQVAWTTVAEKSVHKEGGRVDVSRLKLGGLTRKLVAETRSLRPQDLPPFTVFRRIMDVNYAGQCVIPHQRVIEIRQRVFLYPATEGICSHRDGDRRFLIYGNERRVHFLTGYPISCCTIL